MHVIHYLLKLLLAHFPTSPLPHKPTSLYATAPFPSSSICLHHQLLPFSEFQDGINMKRSRTTAQKREALNAKNTDSSNAMKFELDGIQKSTVADITVKVEADESPNKRPKRCKLDADKAVPPVEVVTADLPMGVPKPPPVLNRNATADNEASASQEQPLPVCITADWDEELEAAVVDWAEKNGY